MSACNSNDANKSHIEQIQDLYTELAKAPHKDFGWDKGKDNARALGYADGWLSRLPGVVWESAAAVGNPFSVGAISVGQTVVDLGCGAGADACVAALLVGDAGSVVGIDCTPAMISKARDNAAAAGLAQVIFYVSDMTSLPIPDACADLVISNGAVNLSSDKVRVLAEAYRVLRSGGRLQIADMVKDPFAAEPTSCSATESWADCVSGTLAPDEFIAQIVNAGFSDVRLTDYTGYRTAAHTVGALIRGQKE